MDQKRGPLQLMWEVRIKLLPSAWALPGRFSHLGESAGLGTLGLRACVQVGKQRQGLLPPLPTSSHLMGTWAPPSG